MQFLWTQFTHTMPGGSFFAFLFILYPWHVEAGLFLFLKRKRLIPEVSRARIAAATALSAVNFALLCRGFYYESLISQEMIVPMIVFHPYLRAQVTSIRRLLLVLVPLLVTVIVEQLKASQFANWICPSASCTGNPRRCAASEAPSCFAR